MSAGEPGLDVPRIVKELPLMKHTAHLFSEVLVIETHRRLPVPNLQSPIAFQNRVHRPGNLDSGWYGTVRVNHLDAEDGCARKKLGFDGVTQDPVALDDELLEPFDGPRLLRFVLLTKGLQPCGFGSSVECRTVLGGDGAFGLDMAHQHRDGRVNPRSDRRVRGPLRGTRHPSLRVVSKDRARQPPLYFRRRVGRDRTSTGR